MLEWLLKYPFDWYVNGRIGIAWPWWLYLLLLLAVATGVGWFGRHVATPGARGPFLLRTLSAALLLWLLAGPVLVTEVPRSVDGHVAVLVDDSLSMRLGGAGSSRAEAALRLIGRGVPGARQDSLGASLESRFDTRYFGYGEGLRELGGAEVPGFGQSRSELGAALLEIAAPRNAGNLAAVVLVGDGATADVADRRRLDAALMELRAAGVAVHAVLPGADDPSPDLELRALRLPDRILAGDRIEAEIEIGYRGVTGGVAMLVLEQDGLLMDRSPVALVDERGAVVVRRSMRFDVPGPRLVTARVEPLTGEVVVRNNVVEYSVVADAGPLRVLHVEGEPRFEVKFLRRAVADDPVLRLTSLVRTADNKYYRAGIEDLDDLVDGFPTAAEALFRYHVLVLGSVAAGMLDDAQWSAVRDFVSHRGGALVLLGGRDAFAEGGHRNTVLSELSPVAMETPRRGFRVEARAALAATAAGHPLLGFAGAEALDGLLARLPALEMRNPVRAARPGATVLLEAADADGALVVLATQRYGRGRVASFAVTDSWRWQLHSSVDPDDQTHEDLWRHLLRELGRHAGYRVRLLDRRLASTPGTPVAIRAVGLSARHRPDADARLYLQTVSPAGTVERSPLTGVNATGVRTGTFVPGRPGRYEVTVELEQDGEVIAAEHAVVDVSVAGAEYRHADIDRGLLGHVAATTGGAVWDGSGIDDLPDRLARARGGVTDPRTLSIRDVPLLLLVLAALVAVEWWWRRARRLP